MVLPVRPSVRHVVKWYNINKRRPEIVKLSPNGSPNTLVFGDEKMLQKFEGYHPNETIFYRYPHSGMWRDYTFAAIELRQPHDSSKLTSSHSGREL